MAQNIVKSLKENPPKIRKNNGLEDRPMVKLRERTPKILRGKEKTKTRPRAGNIQMGINPYGKPKVINNGCKIK